MRGVWHEVAAVIRRYPLAAFAPAVALGAGAACLQFVEGDLLGVVLVGLLLVIAFELYVAYIERLVLEFERGAVRVSVGELLLRAAPLVPALVGASIIGVTVPLAASGLLVIPGLWLLTRWSLFAPVISKERAEPVAAIRRSNELVRGHFWPVFATVTLSLLVEHGVIHATALAAESLLRPPDRRPCRVGARGRGGFAPSGADDLDRVRPARGERSCARPAPARGPRAVAEAAEAARPRAAA